ncbi:MAG TPA: thioredoxin [Candidatus Avoscillospira stercorigallinarum]|uniref:Thioredoxin n=1 Tax=Candidatus Avoscillospira stercorigallinarum TaxID=2840708 RepID=A0A9D0Z613_9FIRM|nr:thioredoxin [Candidatus Avoscillospira stercorigallinarum]
MEYTLTKDNFQELVLDSQEKILVDFWATWCGPCMMLSPIVEELAETCRVGKVNVDEEPELARQFGIVSIPTLIVFENGKAVRQSMGYRPKSEIEAFWEG